MEGLWKSYIYHIFLGAKVSCFFLIYFLIRREAYNIHIHLFKKVK